MKKELYIKEMCPGIYLMDEGHECTGYLVVGREKACMIDTMLGYNDLKQAAAGLTDKPVIVINTHGHPDHIYGNLYFDHAYLHPADIPFAEECINDPEFAGICRKYNLRMPPFSEVREGDVFDLGERHLEIYELPGHTPGGIVLLLREDRILFTGDSVNHHLWMQLEGCAPLDEFVKNLDRIMFLENKADRILHGHARDFDDISLMRCMRNGIQELVEGRTENDKPYHYFEGEVRQHPFTCLPDRQYSQEEHVIIYDPDKLLIDNAIKYIRELFREDFGGHDAEHSLRVYRNAVMIAESESACDREIVSLAALLHDADDHKLFSTTDNANARSFLEKNHVPQDRIDRICEAINSVSFSRNKDRRPETIEGMIVQDADRLDALGAIGIARTFAYGGEHSRPLDDSVQHFHEKLLLLKDLMNTEAGKTFAERRHAFLESFIAEYKEETAGGAVFPETERISHETRDD